MDIGFHWSIPSWSSERPTYFYSVDEAAHLGNSACIFSSISTTLGFISTAPSQLQLTFYLNLLKSIASGSELQLWPPTERHSDPNSPSHWLKDLWQTTSLSGGWEHPTRWCSKALAQFPYQLLTLCIAALIGLLKGVWVSRLGLLLWAPSLILIFIFLFKTTLVMSEALPLFSFVIQF